ncbi:MAG: hypothetical protein EXS16_07255 [Gemmataceae bacterium]|nr:hypothetical protein [Gemmataceae bacterium]
MRREDKKRRREKRQSKGDRAGDRVDDLIKMLDRAENTPPPATFPGGCDPSVSRPDALKFEFSQWLSRSSGSDLMRRFERNIKHGLLCFVPEIDHWAMEEFFWHGAANDSWQPIDAFLTAHGDRFPPAAREQIKLWKQAKIGCYEVGACADDLISLRERDPLTMQPVGDWVRAIALNIGGVNAYASQKGSVSVTYLAPWAPEQNIYCAMGYGMGMPANDCASAAVLVQGMRNIKAVAVPLPFRTGKVALQQCLEKWLQRDWFTWMKEHVRCPFPALVTLPERGQRILTIDDWVTQTAEEAERIGLHFCAAITPEEVGVLGGTTLIPLDFAGSTATALAEYQAFRIITDNLMQRGRR